MQPNSLPLYSTRQKGQWDRVHDGMAAFAHSVSENVARGVACDCERGNSATGHIDFLEFINASALSFARKTMQHARQPRFYTCDHPLDWVHAGPGTTRLPNPPYPSTQPARPARERVKRAFAASHQSEPSKRAVPVEHLRAQHARAISRVRGSRAPMRNPGLTTGESSAPETPGTVHS